MDRGRRLSRYEIEVEELRALNEQLNVEIHIKPMMVSETVAELKKYLELNQDEDRLVSGFPNKKENPFEEKGGCVIL